MANSKGWFKQFIDFRKNRFLEGSIHVSRHHDISLYNILQPTGLLYGAPVEKDNQEKESDSYDEKQQLELVLAECLVNSYLLFRTSEAENEEGYKTVIEDIPRLVHSFYSDVFPDYAASDSTLFGQKKNIYDVTEKTIHNRIYNRPGGGNNFWTHLFYNALIFLDIYLFSQWINLKSEKIVAEFFREEKEELRLTVMKIIVAAAHANEIVELSERKMFDVLLKSAQLSKEREKQAIQFLNEGVLIHEIELPKNNSWLLKKFFLEMAILMVWADREIDEKEWDFLMKLANHLGFFKDDIDKSMIAIEGFLLSHWEQIAGLGEHQSQESIKEDYINRISFLANRNESKILVEINGNESLRRLIDRFMAGDSSLEDEDRLRNSLTDILQKLPSLKTVILPRSIFTLSILFEILPKSIGAKS